MSTATLTFNLPEETEEYKYAVSGSKYYISCYELDDYLRSKLKHDENLSDDEIKAYGDCRDMLHNILSDNEVAIW